MTKRAADESGQSSPKASSGSTFLLLCAVLAITLATLFAPSFRSGWTHFLNDGPLGALKADYNKTPDAFFGVWQDLNWIGSHGGSLLPSFTFGQFQLLGPVGYSKFHAPIALFGLGIATWFACRLLGFNRSVSFLTAIAASLNMNVFSNACWGLSSRPWALATSLLAIGAIGAASSVNIWLRCALAGLAVGMGITEGADVGIIFSVFVGVYAFYFTFFQNRPSPASAAVGVGRVVVVAGFAFLMAYHIIASLVFNAKVLDAVSSQKQMMDERQQWNWATQWSLPKDETLRVIIPGLHGYRMDTPNGGRYWGAAGQDANWKATGQGFARFSGAGEYAGVTVVVFALFALGLAAANPGGVYTRMDRLMVAFWLGVAVLSLSFAWGRYAPFYEIIYHLPIFSSMRNPIKWTHTLHFALLLLSAYGMQGLWRGYLEKPMANLSFSQWWAKAGVFEKRWVWGSVAFIGVSALGWLIYVASGDDLAKYLQANGVVNGGEAAESVTREIARHSQSEVAKYLVGLVASCSLLILGLSGYFSGRKAQIAAIAFGVLLVVDLGRANRPWIQHYNYELKYASNPVLDYLRQAPGHNRTTVFPFGMRELGTLQQVYHVEWMQQQFPFYNIPSLDVVQDPRPSPENVEFRKALQAGTNIVRMWELTSTRYFFGLAGEFSKAVSDQIDGGRGRFRPVLPFNIFDAGEQRIGVTSNEAGPYALIEFTGALPRAHLVTTWESTTNAESILPRLVDPKFDPATSVIVLGNLPASKGGNSGGTPKAEITAYSPKRITVKTQADAAGILVLADKFDADWRVLVDGVPASLLRCNYLFRGVQVPAGEHQVQFVFQPSTTGLYVSLSAIGLAVVLGCALAFAVRRA